MKGKVFESSMDVYQDQAQVLFDFYLNAAQKIIDQEDGFDKQCEELDKEIDQINESASHVSRDYMIGGVLLVIGLILLAVVNPIIGAIIVGAGGVYFFKTYRFKQSIQSSIDDVEQKKQEVITAKDKIFRDYKVSKIGVVYVPVAKKVAFGEKSVMVDLTESVAPTTVSLQVANNPSALVNTLKDLEKLSTEAPIIERAEQVEEVETSDYSSSIQDVKFYDYFGTMDRTLRTGAYYLSDVSTKNIKVPFILPGSKQMNYVDMFATTEVENEVTIPVFQENRFDNEMDEFKKISDFQAQFAQENADFEEVLKHLIANIGVAVQTVATMKVASNNKLIDSSNQLLFTILKNSYNHYSPLLEHDEIEKIRNTNFNYSDTVENYKPFQLKESSRVKYDVQTGNWVAEDGTVTTMPFGISQIQEEIVAPIVQNLLAETRIERMRVYNDIKNQKIDYLNQWHQDTEDFYGRNRTSSDDLLNIMRSNMTKFLAAQATVESVAEIKSSMKNQMLAGKKSDELEDKTDKQDENNLAAFEVQSQQFRKAQEDFDDYMDRLKDDIDERARNFEYIEYYDASLRDRLAKDLVSAGDNQDQLDNRRRPLASINPLYAQSSVLPPSPSIDDSVSEQLSLNVAQYASNTLSEISEQTDNGSIVETRPEESQRVSEESVAENGNEDDSVETDNVVFDANQFKSEQQSDDDVQSDDVNELSEDNDLEEESDEEILDETDENEKTYSVILMSAGEGKLQVVNAIKDLFGLGLAEAKDLVDSAPTPIAEHLSLEDAEELKESIMTIGAEVDLMEE